MPKRNHYLNKSKNSLMLSSKILPRFPSFLVWTGLCNWLILNQIKWKRWYATSETRWLKALKLILGLLLGSLTLKEASCHILRMNQSSLRPSDGDLGHLPTALCAILKYIPQAYLFFQMTQPWPTS